MGMFDWVECFYPLPDGRAAEGIRFQSKDTPIQGLLIYRITPEGRLLVREAQYARSTDPASPFGWSIREIVGSERWVDTEHHGDIVFYTHVAAPREAEGSDAEGPLEWVSYRARFTSGNLEAIVLTEAR